MPFKLSFAAARMIGSTHKMREIKPLTADQALQKLIDGNRRFVNTKFKHPHQTAEWRQSVAAEQHPFAVILGCSDSRVPPEIIFDEGLGDLFVIREAGHVADDATLGSIEFAVGQLQVPLVMVLGHTRCGAVRATVDVVLKRKEVSGHIERLVNDIRPAVLQVRDEPGDVLDLATHANVLQVVNQLKTSEPFLKKYVAEGKLRIVGAYYDLNSGEVRLLEPTGITTELSKNAEVWSTSYSLGVEVFQGETREYVNPNAVSQLGNFRHFHRNVS